jgi:hypothetical protein
MLILLCFEFKCPSVSHWPPRAVALMHENCSCIILVDLPMHSWSWTKSCQCLFDLLSVSTPHNALMRLVMSAPFILSWSFFSNQCMRPVEPGAEMGLRPLRRGPKILLHPCSISPRSGRLNSGSPAANPQQPIHPVLPSAPNPAETKRPRGLVRSSPSQRRISFPRPRPPLPSTNPSSS